MVAHAARLIDTCRARSLTLSIAESCTGGLVSGLITAVPGASLVLERSLVTYRDTAKTALLGVAESLLLDRGAVSREVAEAMVRGVQAGSQTGLAAATTGYAGPDAPADGQPVGRVFIATLRHGQAPVVAKYDFGDPGRERVQLRAIAETIALLTAAASQ